MLNNIKENEKNIIIKSYLHEKNFNRRRNFLIFLNGSNLIEKNNIVFNNNNNNNIIINNNDDNQPIKVEQKVLSLRPLYENVMSYL
jgi:hypothetical protein